MKPLSHHLANSDVIHLTTLAIPQKEKRAPSLQKLATCDFTVGCLTSSSQKVLIRCFNCSQDDDYEELSDINDDEDNDVENISDDNF